MSLRILVADDHVVVRKGLREILGRQPGWEVCWEAANGLEAVEIAIKDGPDVIVMDIYMPEVDGVEATIRILAKAPQSRIVILSFSESPNMVRQLLRCGAVGYVLKSDVADELVEAVAQVSNGGIYYAASVAEAVMAQVWDGRRELPDRDRQRCLSQRECDVLRLLALGRSNKEVAQALRISWRTVETHRANLMEKLGSHSLADLVRYAMANQIVESEAAGGGGHLTPQYQKPSVIDGIPFSSRKS